MSLSLSAQGSLGLFARRILLRGPTTFSILDQGLVSGLGFLTGIVVARLTGLEEFGRFAVVMILSTLAQAAQNAAVVAPVMSLAGTRRGRSPAFFASACAATLALSVPLAFAVAGLLIGLDAIEGKPAWVGLAAGAAALAVAQNLLFTARRLLFALGRGRDGLAMDAARGAALALAFAVLWLFRLPTRVDVLVWTLAAAAGLPAILAMLPILAAARGRWRARALFGRCWPLGRWMLPTIGLTFGQEQVVWLVVGAMLGDAAVGGLRGAQYVVSLAYPFLAALENVAPLQASRAYEERGVRGLRAYTGRLLVLYSPLAVGFPLLAAVFADDLLRLFFGPAFQAYDGCLRVFALVVLFVFVRDVLGYFFRAVQRTRFTFQAFAVSCAITVAAMIPLIWGGGVLGAAVAIATGQGVSMVYLVACMVGMRKVPL